VEDPKVVGGVEKKQDGAAADRARRSKTDENRKALMAREFFLRTGVGANRSGTAKLALFSALSAGISTDFSTVSSENLFQT
jgi:hypothetical protein